MNNPYERPAGFEQGFSFEIEGRKYDVETGKTETEEGDKYRVGIFDTVDFTTMPLVEHVGLTNEELKEMVDFLKTSIAEDLSIEEIKKQFMGHAIDKHNERNKES